MKFIKMTLENFGSYKNLEFDFIGSNLTLMQGKTGSGKSTFQDAIPWILYGTTSKNGAVQDVRPWNTKEVTKGILLIKLPQSDISITRIRGSNKENDLYFKINGKTYRGKDLSETQKKIEEIIGLDSVDYLAAAQFNEFSDANLFFLAKTKQKREMLEKIASLDICVKLLEKIQEKTKEEKRLYSDTKQRHDFLDSQNKFTQTQLAKVLQEIDAYEDNRNKTLNSLEEKEKTFLGKQSEYRASLERKESEYEAQRKEKINDIALKIKEFQTLAKPLNFYDSEIQNLLKIFKANPICKSCGQPTSHVQKLNELKLNRENNKNLINKIDELSNKIKDINLEVNPYTIAKENLLSKNTYKEQYLSEKQKENPHKKYKSQLEKSLIKSQEELQDLELALKNIEKNLALLSQLHGISFNLRKVLLYNVVEKMQNTTNFYLEQFFDSEIKVEFIILDNDCMDVNVYKNNNLCRYAQLSRGQRSLLRLCFGVSFMNQVANNKGIQLDTLFFDEVLDGVHSDLKSKVVSFFEYLNKTYPNIFVIDHDILLKTMFDKKIDITLKNGHSNLQYGA